MEKKSENRNIDSMEIQEEGMKKVCPCCEKNTARSEEIGRASCRERVFRAV